MLIPNIWTGGQSNDVGGGNMADLPSNLQYLRSPYPHVQYREQIDCPSSLGGSCAIESDWRQLSPRTNAFGNQFIGPELMLGRGLWDRAPEKPFTLIKTATSGTTAQEWIDFLLPRAIGYVKSSAQGPTRLFNWVHGESATGSDSLASLYPSQLISLFLTIRAAFGPEVVIVLNLLHTQTYSLEPARAARVPAVRAAQLYVASQMDRLHVVDCDDLALKSDFLHYQTASFLTMGDRFVTVALQYPDLLSIE